MKKYEAAAMLARHFGYSRYLEICTTDTGLTFDKLLAEDAYAHHDRILYNCPDTFDDGLPLTLRTSKPTAFDALETLIAASDSQRAYDLIFVDSWHNVQCSMLDMIGAWRLLKPGGAMVVHDCNPESARLASSAVPVPYGEWCGLSYQAYIEFLLSGFSDSFLTIDSDYGIGVVFKSRDDDGLIDSQSAYRTRHQLRWQFVRNNDTERYAYFDRNRRGLLNLMAPEDFARAYGAGTRASRQPALNLAE